LYWAIFSFHSAIRFVNFLTQFALFPSQYYCHPRYYLYPIAGNSPKANHGVVLTGPILLKRILIVDDSSLIRRNLRRTLESVDDWQVVGEAVNGREGIEKANELRPDLIVLDLSMPVLNGFEAGRNLHKTMPEIPLILYSLHTDKNVEKEALALGFSSVLSKSADTNDLLNEARTLLQSH
jgi:CheY-like chemotaxis protein